MTLIHVRALIYQGCDTADICRSTPVKLFILTPDIGGLYASDLRCYSLHLISTCDLHSFTYKIALL